MSSPISGRYLSFAEREDIAVALGSGHRGPRDSSPNGRNPATVSRELTRNAVTRPDRLEYRASVAQWKVQTVAIRPKAAKLATNPRLHHYAQDHLEGKIHDADGREIAGPRQAQFRGRNKPHCGDRPWVNGWSAEQIANRLQIDFQDDQSMRISHKAIYQSLYIQGRSAFKRELVSCLRTGWAVRLSRAMAQAKAWAQVQGDLCHP